MPEHSAGGRSAAEQPKDSEERTRGGVAPHPTDYGADLFRLLVETVEDYAIFALDADGRVVHWNAGAERTLGFTAAEVLGKPLSAIFTAEDRALGLPALELMRAAETGRSDDERWHVRKDGSVFWAQGVVVPLRSPDGSLRGFGKILRDRTDLKQRQDALEGRADALSRVDRQKDRFIATLAHELRNPLAPLVNAVQLLRVHAGRLPELRSVADLMDRQIAQLRRLVDDLRDIARIGRGDFELTHSRIRVEELVARAVETARPLIDAAGCELRVMGPTGPVDILADPDRLHQVLVNLLHNAAKFTGRGGQVTLDWEPVDREVAIRVTDTGIGIAPERLPRIFEMFERAGNPTSGVEPGLGIGLALVRDLVALHGGSVEAWSAGPGKGSTFTVRLPRG